MYPFLRGFYDDNVFYRYNGKRHNHTIKLELLLRGLAAKGLSPKAVIIIPFDQNLCTATFSPPTRSSAFSSTPSPITLSWSAFLQGGTINANAGARNVNEEFRFYPTPFNHPLWILFSSGTTGKPKAIVHRAGGILLQSRKEFAICAGLRKEDVFFYYTTTGWMMWNFLVSGLSTGCTLVLYDGSPLKDPSMLWSLVDELGITVFGTSAKYLEQLSVCYCLVQLQRAQSLTIYRRNTIPVNITSLRPSDISIPPVHHWHLSLSTTSTDLYHLTLHRITLIRYFSPL